MMQNQNCQNMARGSQTCGNQNHMNSGTSGCTAYRRTASGQQAHPGMSCPQPQPCGRTGIPAMQHCAGTETLKPQPRRTMCNSQPQPCSQSQPCSQPQPCSQSQPCGQSRQQLMKQVMLCGFACVEASLYLDTHPDDAEAISYFKEHVRIYQEALEEYSKNYGPLTLAHARHCDNYWNWVNQPWPWQ